MSQSDAGRVRQKQRTRGILLAAARDALREGLSLGVAEVADRAGISRATAYRYYSSPEVMMNEAVLDGIAAEIDTLQLDAASGAGLEQRIETVVDEILAMVLRNEALFRIYLRSTLAGQSEPRGARRLRWVGQAIGPDRGGLSVTGAKRLTQALALVTGIETIITLRDVCGLDDQQIQEVARWSARALLKAALEDR